MADNDQSETGIVTRTRTKTERKLKKPPLYKVLLHNDDFTTMEFVIRVLVEVFNKGEPEAAELTLQVHTRGACLAGEVARHRPAV